LQNRRKRLDINKLTLLYQRKKIIAIKEKRGKRGE
jgi:hypothetical protein